MNFEDTAIDIGKMLDSFGAKKVEIYDLSAKETYTKYIIISSSPNEETSQNFATALENYLIEKYSMSCFQKEGMHKGNWIILDYINFVVHIMIESQREKYKIDGLYKATKKLTYEKLTIDNL